MKKKARKKFLISRMLEVKRIELETKRNSLIYKLKSLFTKQPKKEKEKIEKLEKTLERKEVEELEEMILEKQHVLLTLEKKTKKEKEKEKIREVVKLAEEIRKKEGKRGKIAREIGFHRKEILELKKELEEKVGEIKAFARQKKTEKEKKRAEEEPETEEITPAEERTETEKKKNKTRKKKKEKNVQLKKKKRKTRQKISFITPEEELKKKREQALGEKKKKAVKQFHEEFTTGKEKTLVSIKGDAQIITGKTVSGKTEPSKKELIEMQQKREEEINFEIEKTKEKIKNLKKAFFHRQINEEDYRKKLFEYDEELKTIEIEKRRPKPMKESAVKEIEGKPELKTVQEEQIEEAVKHTPSSKQKLEQAMKTFHKEFTSNSYFGGGGPSGVYKIESPEKLEASIKPTGIVKRIAPTIKDKTAMQMEEKIVKTMKKNNISEGDIRKEFEFISPQDLMKRFDRILDAIERKYAKKTEIIRDKTFAETTVGEMKKEEEKTGKMKEIQEKKIVTDFDRLLELVKKKGIVNEKEAGKLLGLSSERVKQCYAVLEKNDLVKLEFPVFGGAKLIAKNYVVPKKEKKKKRNG